MSGEEAKQQRNIQTGNSPRKTDLVEAKQNKDSEEAASNSLKKQRKSGSNNG
jgi:hypothetical protein